MTEMKPQSRISRKYISNLLQVERINIFFTNCLYTLLGGNSAPGYVERTESHKMVELNQRGIWNPLLDLLEIISAHSSLENKKGFKQLCERTKILLISAITQNYSNKTLRT